MNWQSYDPNWLIQLAKEQHPDKPWLIEALRECRSARTESPAYTHFVDPDKPNEEGSDWQFADNISLIDNEKGELILDILEGERVGGVEFIAEL